MIISAVAFGGPAGTTAQERLFRSGVEIVPLTVTVTDRAGEYVTGLTRNDFTILEDGVPQPLAFFAAGQVPIDLALVLDTSASMLGDMPLVRAAARGLVQTMRTADRGAVLLVNKSVSMAQPFTGNREEISAALDAASAAGTTAVYDGLYIALKELVRERRDNTEVRRQVLVLLSDGLDNASHVSVEDVAEEARRVGASIYVITLRSDRMPPDSPRRRHEARALFDLHALAQDAGGRTFHPATAQELPDIYAVIASELASQYDLGYVPARHDDNGRFRRLAVRVLPPAHGVARTRSGYYAERGISATAANEPDPGTR